MSSSSAAVMKYPYPATLDPRSFVSINLSKENYSLWHAQMFCFIQSQELDGFIDGTIPTPDETIAKDDCLAWNRSDKLVKTWILGSLSEHVLGTVVGLATARDVWTKLEDTLSSNPSQEIQEQKQEQKAKEQEQEQEEQKEDEDEEQKEEDQEEEEEEEEEQKEDEDEDEEQKEEDQEEEEQQKVEEKMTEYWRYLPLYEAALIGDWPAAEKFCRKNQEAVSAIITHFGETTLHIAVGTKKAIHFVKELVKLMPVEALATMTKTGDTALSVAAQVGNTTAAIIMVEKNPDLVYIPEKDGRLPLHMAALCGQRDTLLFLRKVTIYPLEPSPFSFELGVRYQGCLIDSGLFDIALDFAKHYPHLITLKLGYSSPLSKMVKMPLAFRSTCRFNIWENFIYHCVPIKLENNSSEANSSDIENPTDKCCLTKRYGNSVFQRLCFVIWYGLGILVRHIEQIRHQKLVHCQALQLLKWLCYAIKTSNSDLHHKRCTKKPIINAASEGTYEVVEDIVEALPSAAWTKNEKDHYILQLAVVNRCEKVFNLIYQMSGWREVMTTLTDDSDNNILHLAGKLAPSHKLNLVSGAALQMQRELQWFKAVEEFVTPADRENLNSDGETPRMVFTKAHKDLVKEGETWMKDTANSCTITAALITTIVFAAAITVPGGNNQNTGLPFFEKKIGFIIFAISDAISLFTSTTSLLMFLGILTARYAEQDFLYALPKRLILGLGTLFVSITTMMMAFSATVYLMYGQKEASTLIPVLVGLACIPIASFGIFQFPLLIDVISSTYGRGIFVKQSNRPFF